MQLSSLKPRMARQLGACALALALCVSAFAAQSNKTKHTTAPKKVTVQRKPAPVAKPKVVAPPVAVGPMVGTWTVREGEKERGDIRVTFKPNGRFAFVGSNFKSEGTYECVDHVLKLLWTSVDGEPVTPGAMHREITLNEGDESFKIDRFLYAKSVKR